MQSYSLSPDEYLEKFKSPHQEITDKGDNDQDQRDLVVLNEILANYYNDSLETINTKQKILIELQQIVNEWMKQITVNTNNHYIDFEELGYGLKVFGSYKLKTNSYDGDIDMLCIVPEYINREKHFFIMLAANFKKHAAITEIFSIPDAIVPLMRLNIYGVQIDLLLSRIKQTFLKENPKFFENDLHSSISISIHERQLRSINGYRTALYLQKNYIEGYVNYRVTLKAIKLWAKNKGVYSQIYGYLGGAAFSIMLAKICQLYPNYSSLQLLDRFFFIYSNWVWTIPVLIQKMEYMERLQNQMVIFTPLDPHMNAGHYIAKITSNITKKQLKIASKVIQQINKGKRHWQELFAPFDFFNEYRNFIEISVMGQKLDDFIPWKGNVESKIRKFIQFLEQYNEFQSGNIEANLYPKSFTSKHINFKYCSKYYTGLKCSSNHPIGDFHEIDLSQAARSFLELLQGYSQIDKTPKEINIGFTYISRQNIGADVLQAFKDYFKKNEPVV